MMIMVVSWDMVEYHFSSLGEISKSSKSPMIVTETTPHSRRIYDILKVNLANLMQIPKQKNMIVLFDASPKIDLRF